MASLGHRHYRKLWWQMRGMKLFLLLSVHLRLADAASVVPLTLTPVISYYQVRILFLYLFFFVVGWSLVSRFMCWSCVSAPVFLVDENLACSWSESVVGGVRWLNAQLAATRCASATSQMNQDFGPLKKVADLHASTSALPTFEELH